MNQKLQKLKRELQRAQKLHQEITACQVRLKKELKDLLKLRRILSRRKGGMKLRVDEQELKLLKKYKIDFRILRKIKS